MRQARRHLLCILAAGWCSLAAADEVMTAEPAPGLSLGAVDVHGIARLRAGHGEENAASLQNDSLEIGTLNLRFDAAIAKDTAVAKDISFYFEWLIYRYGERPEDDVGDAYVQFDQLVQQEWLNMKAGRFEIPFGEEYLWFSDGVYNNPLANYSVACPYGWDEGLLLFGRFETAMPVSYWVHVTAGDEQATDDDDSDKEYGIKLAVEPTPSLMLSASALRTGNLGNADHPAEAAFGWGGTHPFSVNGATLDDVVAWELDAKLHLGRSVELWGAYGDVSVEDGTMPADDRDFHYTIAQALVDGSIVTPDIGWLASTYAVVRYSEIGTYDSTEGYKFVGASSGWSLGPLTEDVSAWQFGVGYHISANAKVVAEYDLYDFNLTDGAAGDAYDRDQYLIDLAIRF
jgi:hypothetical protein